VESSLTVSRLIGVRNHSQRPAPPMVQRHRQARLVLNPRRRPLARDRFAHLKATHD
jgi:hypothetical protein